jgi:hypothetical protein
VLSDNDVVEGGKSGVCLCQTAVAGFAKVEQYGKGEDAGEDAGDDEDGGVGDIGSMGKGLAETCGRINIGDVLVSVNGRCARRLIHARVLQLVGNAMQNDSADVQLGFVRTHQRGNVKFSTVSSSEQRQPVDKNEKRVLDFAASAPKPVQVSSEQVARLAGTDIVRSLCVLSSTCKVIRKSESDERKLLALLTAKKVQYTVTFVDLDSEALPSSESARPLALPQVLVTDRCGTQTAKQEAGLEQMVGYFDYDKLPEMADTGSLDAFLLNTQPDDSNSATSHPALS